VLNRINIDFGEITNVLPSIYYFIGGESGSYIEDGGNDLFDDGNMIRFNNDGSRIPYVDNIVVRQRYFGSFGRYFTRKVPGLFVFAADVQFQPDLTEGFKFYSDLGLDGKGYCNYI
jgi:hypothetical protein